VNDRYPPVRHHEMEKCGAKDITKCSARQPESASEALVLQFPVRFLKYQVMETCEL
jgi:hypothetical protein